MRPRPHSRPAEAATKEQWRSWARRVRSQGDPTEIGSRIAGKLRGWLPYQSASRVLIYLAFANEPDLEELLEDHEKAFYTTRTDDTGEPGLTLHRLDQCELEHHRFGFRQPAAGSAGAEAGSIDLVLVPGLAFDLTGNRLGFGMGYYDRLLGTLAPTVPRVGVCPSSLLVPSLPVQDHDVPMTHLASEDGVFPIRRK